jgi:hypothetical protein
MARKNTQAKINREKKKAEKEAEKAEIANDEALAGLVSRLQV